MSAFAAADEHRLIFKSEFHGSVSFAMNLAPATSRKEFRKFSVAGIQEFSASFFPPRFKGFGFSLPRSSSFKRLISSILCPSSFSLPSCVGW